MAIDGANRMQVPITLVKPAQTMLAMRYNGEENFESMSAFLADAIPDRLMGVTTMGHSFFFTQRGSYETLGGIEGPYAPPGTWVIADDTRKVFILATDYEVTTMFTILEGASDV